MLESLGMQTSVCLPFQREGYGEELGLSMRPLQQEIRQADLLIAFGGDGASIAQRYLLRACRGDPPGPNAACRRKIAGCEPWKE